MPEVIIPNKRCPSCGEVKPRTDFAGREPNKCGYCRTCAARKQRERCEAKRVPIQHLNGEEWRDVVGYEGVYKVSNLGRVQRLKGYKCAGDRLLNPSPNKGYLEVMLCKNGTPQRVRVHRLVAVAFIGPCPKGMEVNHIDHDRANARADNLEYRTHQKNLEYAVEQGRLHTKPRVFLNRIAVIEIKQMLRHGVSIERIARLKGVSLGAITGIKYGHNWKHVQPDHSPSSIKSAVVPPTE